MRTKRRFELSGSEVAEVDYTSTGYLKNVYYVVANTLLQLIFRTSFLLNPPPRNCRLVCPLQEQV